MLATDYKYIKHGSIRCIAMPKLDGIRAGYEPGVGFISRGDIEWDPAKLAHIKPPSGYAFDGELYVHGWSLQRIAAAVAVNSPIITEDTKKIEYHIYDLPHCEKGVHERMAILERIPFEHPCHCIEFKDMAETCYKKKDALFSAYVARGYEGLMLKRGLYEGKRSENLLRKKYWRFATLPVTTVMEGEGKRKGMAGSIIAQAQNGRYFPVGTGFSEALAMWLWENKATVRFPVRIKIQYSKLSEAGIPLNASFVQAFYRNAK